MEPIEFDGLEEDHRDPPRVYELVPGSRPLTMADINAAWDKIFPTLWSDLNEGRTPILDSLLKRHAEWERTAVNDYYTTLPASLRPR